MSVFSLINALPKAEVHSHLEFSLTIQRSYEIAKRNSVVLSLPIEEALEKVKKYENLCDFLELMCVVRSALVFEDDFYELAMGYFKLCHDSGVVYCEPSYHVWSLLNEQTNINTVMNGLWRAFNQAEITYGIRTNLIYTLGRSHVVDINSQSLNLAKHHQEKIKGIGLSGDETSHSSKEFVKVFDLAYNLGLTGTNNEFVAIHTGEEAPPDRIIETLHYLDVGRIDHGIRAWDDPSLVKMLSYTQMPIATCPISNKSLNVLDRFCPDHYVYNSFLDEGCLLSINTDGPTHGGGTMYENYCDYAAHNTDLEESKLKEKIITLAKNSFKCSFLTETEKMNYIRDIERISQETAD